MTFIETQVFTRLVQLVMSDDEYSDLQRRLIANPTGGVLIPGGGGSRKLRWGSRRRGRGKRGGMRVIYYPTPRYIYMLFVYDKNTQDDLAPRQLKEIRAYLERRGL